jgi:hypothetical protein
MKMKNILKYSALTFMLFVLNACFDDPGTDVLLEEKFVSFKTSTAQIREPDLAGSAMIDLSYVSSEDVLVTYEIEELGAIEGIDYEIVSPNPLVIPAGSFGAELEVAVTDNTTFEPNARQFKVTITSVSGGVVAQGNSSITFTVVNNDCQANTSVWYGNISLYDVGYATTLGTGSANATGDCNILQVAGDVSGAGVATVVLVYFTPTTPGATSGTVNVPSQNGINGSTRYKYEGTGVYDEVTGVLLINYKFSDTVAPTGGNNWTGQMEIKKP